MEDFEKQLIRLKQALSLKEDQQIAEALGMTKASFSDRKKRGSFPSERVIGLKSKHPDLDVFYVLTGDRSPHPNAEGLLVAVSSTLGEDAVNSLSEGHRKELALAKIAWAHPQLRTLIDSALWCDDDSLTLLVQLASHLASRRTKSGKGTAREDLESALAVQTAARLSPKTTSASRSGSRRRESSTPSGGNAVAKPAKPHGKAASAAASESGPALPMNPKRR